MMQGIFTRRGQSVLEYSVMLAAMIVVVVAMQTYFKRAVQGRWKSSADQVGDQFTTGQFFTIETQQQAVRKEDTGTTGIVSPTAGGTAAWTRSEVVALPTELPADDITAVGGVIGGKLKGHEVTRTDYVKQNLTEKGPVQKLGEHGTFDSGILKDVGLFQDDD